ncbi:Izh4p KNAG_0K00670 [Huiozyma naganishii CBS 8797]|uniref:Uncharacterized protein n=1 Tax=Huiozyma naganishii (strain ATCC MYA-139 / BCRC 22969 / CBS 8797 / KCTC 17520 / NBRC 10181 / NCYC 3082 / Yp74L-3) TaxID=1071383 RepID=J7RC12_HUIN7|nr:hypothetical protein KNAG_0K00670 [Kazachstania naganishii CBS 8797]CCK72435.1 hypothetical protein KNAG_0K00670 [Kazachstania naganishii CBS 8797]
MAPQSRSHCNQLAHTLAVQNALITRAQGLNNSTHKPEKPANNKTATAITSINIYIYKHIHVRTRKHGTTYKNPRRPPMSKLQVQVSVHAQGHRSELWWTGSVTAVYFVLLVFFTDVYLVPRHVSTTMTDYVLLNVFLATAFQCAACHMVQCFTTTAGSVLSTITMLNHWACSAVTLLYYSYYDNVFYFKLLALFTANWTLVVAAVTVTSTASNSPKRQWWSRRTLLLVYVVVLVSVPLVVGLLRFGTAKVLRRLDWRLLLAELAVYLISGVFYGGTEKDTLPKLPFYVAFHTASLIHLQLLLNAFHLMRAGTNKPTLVSFK